MEQNKAVLIFILLCGIQIINAGHYVGDYYVSIPDKLDWWGAWKFCTKNGMHLVDVPHDREYRRIFDTLSSLKNRTNIGNEMVWTSGTRWTNNFNWYWITTGQPMVWTKWAPENPNNLATEKCILLWNLHQYQLADFPCENKLVFMCRKTWLSPYLNSKSCY